MLRLGLALVSLLIPILSVACTGTPTGAPKDAREFAVFLVTKAGEGDWTTIRRLLVPEFQEYREDALHRALDSGGGSISETVWPSFRDPNQWQEERHQDFTNVRVISVPVLALVLRHGAGGEWRLDPGPYARALAEVFQKAEPSQKEVRLTEVIPRNYSTQLQTNADTLQLARRLSSELMNVSVQGENVNLTWQVKLNQVSHAEVPLTGLTWRTADKRGPARVVWTTAVLKEDALIFPSEGSASVRYLVTLGLEGVPEAEAVEVEVKDIVVDGMALSVSYSFEPNNL